MVGLLKLIGKKARQEIFICQAFFLLNKAQVFGELAGYLECQTSNPHPPCFYLERVNFLLSRTALCDWYKYKTQWPLANFSFTVEYYKGESSCI